MTIVDRQHRTNMIKKIKVYLWILSFVGKYRLPFTILIVTGLINSAVLLVFPKFMEHIIDVVIPGSDKKGFLILIAVIASLIAVMLGSMMVRNLVQRIVQERSANDLQVRIFSHLRKLGFSYYENHPIGETLSLFQAELPAVQNIYRHYLPVIIEKTALLIISFIMLISLNPMLTLLIVPLFLSYYLIGPYFERKQAKYSREGIASRTDYNKKIYDTLSGLLELRIHGTERWDLSRLLKKYEINRKLWLSELLYALLRGTARRMTINMGALLLFIFGAYSVRNGTMQVGQFVAFMLYYFQIMGDLTRVVTMFTEQSILLIQGEKLYDLVMLQPLVQEKAQTRALPDVKGGIILEEINFAYSQMPDRNVLAGLSVNIKPGQRVAFVGSSGGGKSTILKLIGRFYEPTSGVIKLDGVPIDELSVEQLRTALGFVFQETYLFGATIKENIFFGNPEASDEEIIQAAKAANAHDFIMQLPEGYDTQVGERGVKLSGGQKQRIAIARMILKNPSVILLDEATSALDTVSEREVQHALDRLLEGRTTVAVAHRLSTIRDYDLIVYMEHGTVMESGTYEELIAKKGLFYRLEQGGERAVV